MEKLTILKEVSQDKNLSERSKQIIDSLIRLGDQVQQETNVMIQSIQVMRENSLHMNLYQEEDYLPLYRKFKESLWDYPHSAFMREDEFLSLYQKTKMPGLLVMAYICRFVNLSLDEKDLEHEGLSPYYRSFFKRLIEDKGREDVKELAFELINNDDERTDFTDDLFYFLCIYFSP